MRNNLLSITRRSIPYLPQLRALAGSVTASILMQQLDYWFSQKPDGFYKFLSPCNHEAYKPGDSWEEELAFSLDEFRSAFDRIGIRHTSKKAFDAAVAAGTIFTDIAGHQKFYSSYHDRIKGLTFYFRNHSVADAALDSLVYGRFPVNGKSQFTEMGNPDLRKWEKSISVNGKSPSHLYTEITPEITSKITADEAQKKQHQQPLIDEVRIDFSQEPEPALNRTAQQRPSESLPEPTNSLNDHSSAVLPQATLKAVEQLAFNVTLRHWRNADLSLKPEMVQAIWACNPDWFAVKGKNIPNVVHITSYVDSLEQSLRQLNAKAVGSYQKLSNYWQMAQALVNPVANQPALPKSAVAPLPGTDPHWDAIQQQIDEERSRPRVKYVPPQRRKLGVNSDA